MGDQEPGAILPGEILNPQTGEILEPTNPEHLAPAFAVAKGLESAAKAWASILKEAIVKLVKDTPGKGRTRRLSAAGVTIKIELPKEEIKPAVLREAWERWPKLAPKYLRIATVAPIAVEVEKLWNTVGDPELEAFKAHLRSGLVPGTYANVEIEKDERQ